ncbi:MAG: hypothetical protein AAFU64_05270 [Bacteroidota bacterium]
MKRIVCTVQEHMFLPTQIQAIEKGLKEIYKKHYRDEKLRVFWLVMPKGYAYSERKLSEASIILVEVDNDIQSKKREALMHLFSQYLLKEFKLSPLDLMLSVSNSSYMDQFMASQKNRVDPRSRGWISLKMLWTAFYSKFSQGYMKLRVKM